MLHDRTLHVELFHERSLGRPVARRDRVSSPVVLSGLAAVQEAEGRHLGYSDWLEITQERVDQFAEATGDFQWIHVDPERAKDGPFGGTIAHGYLTLSLASFLLPQIVRYEGFTMAVNYGLGKVRFPSPVRVGARIRAGAELAAVTDIGTGVQVKTLVTIEVEGGDKPACVIESLARWFV
jgi:acyl dehydratase